ncbi:DUF2256 domain-containing protein [Synechococcus elongatus]|uniref:DUF2256 domain-containing protein n=2 Tax=Synechococcus elongatus TaxID=32046 RepID=Q31MT8_SYNE7|nr:DUF2256 domain-containing protein [Synechococcus elongatus]ABB57631.1 conserved hypothetical protein [Synechococcus elongatus PCC 7942 = FACHB-805]MBD2588439.1 DUF2256 domain-containing protein [Synechococcus elongatus FACHB-242]MBD2689398.1 DUF2256 domain-containing protein [Synechococcus elongatus FACHB-1061]MBD2708183.1 DUF2256 domain-containing protein [Synechococcus elongatus PCC 7942 = FACHB-805]UOW71421.1 DUF2256 domain-containing protein [Synechococcus elongatus PCC 7943]
MAQRYTKSNLPQKNCLVCGRPFEWRRKWKDCWEEVRYCSDRCRRRRSSASQTGEDPA